MNYGEDEGIVGKESDGSSRGKGYILSRELSA
jgi:hypothetical protein